jgi:ubiquinone/menaquinone biosynthesis C-methylase UbiE
MSKKIAIEIKNCILDEYYNNVYQQFLFAGGAQGRGISYFEKQIENFWEKVQPNRVLEIGGGSGEHLPFLRYTPTEKYVSLDLRPIITKKHLEGLSKDFQSKLSFVEGNAENLPFIDSSFDRVFTTCLLHHVDDVLAVLLEARRVTEVGGEIAFVFPTDPGVLNQFVKKLVSFRKIKKLTKIRPQLFYALEHQNHVAGIMELITYVYRNDDLKFNYRPFRLLHSWNFNLLVVAKIVKK